jgi:RNA polymerase sigma factor (sigma-70 family)
LDNITDIIEGCKKREVQSQKKLYVGYYSVVKKSIRHYVKDADLVNDLTQECFLKIFDKISGYSGTGVFDGWVKRIASNIAIDYYRKNNKVENNTDFEILAESYQETEEEENIITQIGDVANIEFLQQAIDQLPFRIRMVFVLYVMENKSHDEIAVELNISILNSRKRLQTARKWLKDYLISYYKETESKNITWK